jgi:hypothetical protein
MADATRCGPGCSSLGCGSTIHDSGLQCRPWCVGGQEKCMLSMHSPAKICTDKARALYITHRWRPLSWLLGTRLLPGASGHGGDPAATHQVAGQSTSHCLLLFICLSYLCASQQDCLCTQVMIDSSFLAAGVLYSETWLLVHCNVIARDHNLLCTEHARCCTSQQHKLLNCYELVHYTRLSRTYTTAGQSG